MRILLLTNNDGGLFAFRKELIRALCKDNEVFSMLPDEEGKIQDLEEIGCQCSVIKMKRRGTNPLADAMLLCRYVRFCKKNRPDVILTYTVKPNVYGGIAAQITGIPYLSNVTGLGTSIENGGLLSKLTVLLYKIGLRKASCVFFQNKANQDVFEKKAIVRNRSRLIPGSGVNTQDFVYKPYPDDSDGIRFLFVGRIMKNKGIDELLAAINKIHEKYPNTSLDFVGGYDGNYSTIMQKAEATGYIHYHGVQSPIQTWYERAHCIVLPSYHEGTANVLLEASSTGRPVIATIVSGCRETFDEGITGFGCEAKDVDSLVEAMGKVLILSHEELESMGRTGREKMIREYERQKVIDAYIEEIEKVMVNE